VLAKTSLRENFKYRFGQVDLDDGLLRNLSSPFGGNLLQVVSVTWHLARELSDEIVGVVLPVRCVELLLMKVRQHHNFSLRFKCCNFIIVSGFTHAVLTILDYVNKLVHELGIVREAKSYGHVVFEFEDI
jgi:hypothetical protein